MTDETLLSQQKQQKKLQRSHVICYAKITKAHVKQRYWDKNKLFCPLSVNDSPCLTFLGSQTFAYAVSKISLKL